MLPVILISIPFGVEAPSRDAAAGSIVVADAVDDGTAGRGRTFASCIQLDLVNDDGRRRVGGVTTSTSAR